MNSLNIPACHTSLGQITTVTFPFSADGSGSHQVPHLGNHEVATVTKKQKPQIFLFFNKKANINLSIGANEEQVSMSFKLLISCQ